MGPRKRHTPEQVVRKLTQADRLLAEGKEVADVYRELQVAEPTLYRWRNEFGGLKADDVKRLKDLERENAAPKRLLAEAELEKAALKEIARETSKPGPKVGSRSSPHGGDEGQRTVRLPGHRTQRHRPRNHTQVDRDAALRAWLRQWAKEPPRWGSAAPTTPPGPRAGWSTTNASNGYGAMERPGGAAAPPPETYRHVHHVGYAGGGCAEPGRPSRVTSISKLDIGRSLTRWSGSSPTSTRSAKRRFCDSSGHPIRGRRGAPGPYVTAPHSHRHVMCRRTRVQSRGRRRERRPRRWQFAMTIILR